MLRLRRRTPCIQPLKVGRQPLYHAPMTQWPSLHPSLYIRNFPLCGLYRLKKIHYQYALCELFLVGINLAEFVVVCFSNIQATPTHGGLFQELHPTQE